MHQNSKCARVTITSMKRCMLPEYFKFEPEIECFLALISFVSAYSLTSDFETDTLSVLVNSDILTYSLLRDDISCVPFECVQSDFVKNNSAEHCSRAHRARQSCCVRDARLYSVLQSVLRLRLRPRPCMPAQQTA